MALFRKDSLESLRTKVDLIEVLQSYVELKPAGASYKGLCPFHDEKTPSFTVQRGDSHYHCFGCGAHGDAIAFLMEYQKLSFYDAVEYLAHKFGVLMEYEDANSTDIKVNKKPLYDALNLVSRFYHFMLLNTDEGAKALDYLYERGIDLEFIKAFQIGLAPAQAGIFQKTMREKKIPSETLAQVGLLKQKSDGSGFRDFFYDRITIPIHSPSGNVIGFTARKYKEETFGGKYVNSPETPVFKKSRVLFGLNYSRRRIAKEHKAIIVEGQVDALRLIKEGFDLTVASQGTAFGKEHAKELIRLGVQLVYLAFDSDDAGREAAIKVGDIFQKEGVEVLIIEMPSKSDPDTFLRDHGADLFLDLLNGGTDYLTFLVRHYSSQFNLSSPASKNALVNKLSDQIRAWSDDLMIHESLKKLARLLKVPEEIIGVDFRVPGRSFIKQSESLAALKGGDTVNPDTILESDFLRWLLCPGNHFQSFQHLARSYIPSEILKDTVCKKLYELISESESKPDLLKLASQLEVDEQPILHQIMNKKVNLDYAEAHLIQTIQKILERDWMEKREKIMMKLRSGECSSEEEMELVKQFDQIKNAPPLVKCLAKD